MYTVQKSIPSGISPESRRSSASSVSTAASSVSSTKPVTEANLETSPSVFVSDAPVHPLPAYARDFPKPTSEINIAEALQRKPGRWTISGAIEAGLNRQTCALIDETAELKARSAEYAAAKQALLETAAQMKAAKAKPQ